MVNFLDLTYDIVNDGVFAAIACIGFASISNPTRSTFWGCALLAALGHITRFLHRHGCRRSWTCHRLRVHSAFHQNQVACRNLVFPSSPPHGAW